MQYLLIENTGEAPVEGYTTLGFSSVRDDENEGVIDAKHGVNLCLRHGLEVWVYCGTTRIEYDTEHESITDVWHVRYRIGQNKKFKRSGWVLDFEVLDLDDLDMGLRVFISNAIDRSTIREGGLDENLISIKIVDEKRAKAGKTRVYIEVNEEVRAYFANLYMMCRDGFETV